jgi:hypothetical protein
VELPASWISGFYGSGKSSFAKLLGLALDGVVLPDGSSLAAALLRRDDSPRAAEFAQAWEGLTRKVRACAVVFDIGGVARDDEHIHTAALRMVQRRLGYCPGSNHVADFELRLETDGRWEEFLRAAERATGRPWRVAMHEALAEEHFSHALHLLDPERYREPMSWIDARAGAKSGAGSSVSEVVEAIERMLGHRQPEASLFLVIDEVSQYIHHDDGRMLKLQSFVSELGQRLRGRVWLLGTGQQKLEDQNAVVLGKLKDRFPPSFRVHLTNRNIRDVVHKRLLQKRPEQVSAVQSVFRQHRADLKLHGYKCEDISEGDFVEVYPMLPGYVDLLLDITSALRLRSTRAQGDDQTLRGLLQLLGELFRERRLGDRELGELVTFDEIYEVQRTALDVDLQNSLARVRASEVVRDEPLAWRVARAMALLQQVQETLPTTDVLLTQCLYARVGAGSELAAVQAVLDRMKSANLVAYSEKHGFKVQSSAGQEWQRERDEFGVTRDVVSGLARDVLKGLMAVPERPKLKGRPLTWSARYSDEVYVKEEVIAGGRGQDVEAGVDLRALWSRERRAQEHWAVASDQGEARDRVVWIAGDPGAFEGVAWEYARSKRMVDRHENSVSSLSLDRQRCLHEERTRMETLEKRLKEAVSATFLDGTLWFRGRSVKPREKGNAFATVLLAFTEEVLPKLFTSFTDHAVQPKELEQLLQKDLSGPSAKFLEGALGILSLDGGRYVPSCAGAIPTAVLQTLEGESGLSGGELLARFARPPYGWPGDVVKACLAGLLRGSRIYAQSPQGARISSVRDPGAQDLFLKDRDLRLASFHPARDVGITARDRAAICKFFKDYLSQDLDRENDAIADAVPAFLIPQRARLQEVERRLLALAFPLPDTLVNLGKALDRCQGSRHVEAIVSALKLSLDALRDGLDALGALSGALTETALTQVREAREVCAGPLAQLVAVDGAQGLADSAEALARQLALATPWVGIADLQPVVAQVRSKYRAARAELLGQLVARVEHARETVQARDGFAELSADERHAVMRPFQTVVPDTRAEDLTPTLEDLRDRFPERLRRATVEANQLLDATLAEKHKVPVRVVKLSRRGRARGHPW